MENRDPLLRCELVCRVEELEAESTAGRVPSDRQAPDHSPRRRPTMLDQPLRHPLGAFIEHEAPDDCSVLPRDVEVPIVDRSTNVAVELSRRPQIDATTSLPRGGRVKQRNPRSGVRRTRTLDS